MQLWQQLSEHISQKTQTPFKIDSHSAIGGGCINSAFKISNASTDYFIKTNDRNHGDMFEAEALSLQKITDSQTILVPKPICFGHTETQSYLVLEHLNLSGKINSQLLGAQLAAMHNKTTQQFGWQRNNTIGSTPQDNTLSDNWIDFWRDHRLLPQLRLAEKNGFGNQLSPIVERLIIHLDCFFENHQPKASLLHGDLWGGNAAAMEDGTPVIFDPALYYGDRETDIAMTYLFGGFSQQFYQAYNDVWPLDAGFTLRKTLYNLYHILNHLNLFGSGYLNQSISMTEMLLSEV